MRKYSLYAIILSCVLLNYPTIGNADVWRDGYREAIEDGIHSLHKHKDLLRTLLKEMPKGADLHSHLSGAVTIERVIEWGAEDGLCIDTTTYTASPAPCLPGQVPLANALTDKELYQKVLGAWSMEGAPDDLLGAHQHFFDAFGKFGAVLSDARTDDAIADVLSIAGKNHQIYVELMSGLSSSTIGGIANKYILPDDPWNEKTLLDKRRLLIADPLFDKTLQTTRAAIKTWLAGARQLLGCDTDHPDPGCAVDVRFILSANRTRDRGYVFAQWVYAYELIQVAPEVIGVNLVSPEEHPNSLQYYDYEMFALDVLRRYNQQDGTRRQVHIGLHAGELIPAILPATPEGQQHLTFHIRHAVEIAHAERIGHGSDLLDETAENGVEDLLATMRDKNVAVEVCLTSNGTLLGKRGNLHPLRTYLKNDVPVVLATDDQGIFRIDITDEYVKAVIEQRLRYHTLKNLVRASLEYSFLPGKSLWKEANHYDAIVDVCAGELPNDTDPSSNCADLLKSSERATLQWKLEAQFNEFEENLIQRVRH